MSGQKTIELKLKAYDHRVLDRSVASIIQTVRMVGAKVRGAIPLPTNIERITVNRSVHVNKKSREQFEQREHTRLLIVEALPQAVDALMKLDLASGVDVKVLQSR